MRIRELLGLVEILKALNEISCMITHLQIRKSSSSGNTTEYQQGRKTLMEEAILAGQFHQEWSSDNVDVTDLQSRKSRMPWA